MMTLIFKNSFFYFYIYKIMNDTLSIKEKNAFKLVVKNNYNNKCKE